MQMLGSIMGGLGGLFSQNPSDSAMKYLDQIAPMLKEYMNPYIQAGQKQLPGLEQGYGQMMNDPASILKKFGSSFQQDPGYRFNVDEATRASNAASAAGGMGGSPQSMQQSAGIASNMANNNYQEYLNHMLSLFGGGMSGAQGLYDTGFKGASGLSENLANVLNSQAGTAYAGTESQNNRMGGMFGSLGDLLGGKGFGNLFKPSGRM